MAPCHITLSSRPDGERRARAARGAEQHAVPDNGRRNDFLKTAVAAPVRALCLVIRLTLFWREQSTHRDRQHGSQWAYPSPPSRLGQFATTDVRSSSRAATNAPAL